MNSTTEIKNILETVQEKFGYTLLEVSQKIGVTEAALSRWNNGKSEPTRKNIDKLRALASGQPSLVEVPQKDPDFTKKFTEDIFKVLVDAPGRFTQLGEQIKMLQGDLGMAQARIEELEGKLKKKAMSSQTSSPRMRKAS